MKVFTVVAAAFMAMMAVDANATPIFMETFDSEHGGIANTGTLNYSNFTNWITDRTVDLIGNGYYDFYPGHGLYVDLDGSTADSGGLTSKITIGPGLYTLSFQLGGSQRGDVNTVDVSLGNYFETFVLAAIDPLTTYVRTVTVLSPDQLVFQQTNRGDNLGAILDDVKVDTSSDVPEPASLMFLVAGILMLGFMRMRLKGPAA